MWTVPDIKDGPCVDPSQDRNRFRYPVNRLPGNVIEVPEKYGSLYEPGTILFKIFEKIIPFFMGSLVILFFLCTTLYMGFSLLRLFYSDTLKPYKTKTLRALGKHHHHYRRRDSGSEFSDGTHHSLTSSKWSAKLRRDDDKRSFGSGSGGFRHDYGEEENMEEGGGGGKNSNISMTSPPERKSIPGARYPSVSNLLNQNTNLPQLTKFPTLQDRYFVGGAGSGKGRYSMIPIARNKRGDLWAWDPDWYRRQVTDERQTGRVLERLQSAQNVLQRKASVHRPETSQSLPTLTPPVAGGMRPSQMRLFYEREVVTPPPVKREGSRLEVVEPPPPLTTRPPPPSPPPPTPDQRPLTPPSRHDIFERYTFRPQKKVESKFFTAIPKQEKKKGYNDKFMILRGGPRKKAGDIKEIREQRKSLDDNQDLV